MVLQNHTKTYKGSERVIVKDIYAYDFLKSNFHSFFLYLFFTSLMGKRKLYNSANLFLSNLYALIVIQAPN